MNQEVEVEGLAGVLWRSRRAKANRYSITSRRKNRRQRFACLKARRIFIVLSICYKHISTLSIVVQFDLNFQVIHAAISKHMDIVRLLLALDYSARGLKCRHIGSSNMERTSLAAWHQGPRRIIMPVFAVLVGIVVVLSQNPLYSICSRLTRLLRSFVGLIGTR